MKNKTNLLKPIIRALQGAIVGIGAILPGVSGGVLCAAFGLYEPMMELLTEPRKHIKKHLPTFVPFVIGWAGGFILFSLIIGSLLEAYYDIATMLFFGLVCGTVPGLIKKSEKSGDCTETCISVFPLLTGSNSRKNCHTIYNKRSN